MCKAKSFLVVRGETEPRWSDKHDSHTKLIEELGLQDKDHLKRDFVKIEFFPSNGDWFEPLDKWEFAIDEEGSTPTWFEEDKQLWHDRCWDVIARKVLPSITKGHFPGDLRIEKSVNAKFLTTIGGDLYLNSSVTPPNLTTIGGDLYVHSSVTLPKLTTIGGDLSANSSVTLPKLTTIGGYLYVNSSVTLPKLTTISGGRQTHLSGALQN